MSWDCGEREARGRGRQAAENYQKESSAEVKRHPMEMDDLGVASYRRQGLVLPWTRGEFRRRKLSR